MNENENYEAQQKQLKIDNERYNSESAPQATVNVKKPLYKKWWFWIIIGILVIAIISGFAGGDSNIDDQGNGGASDNHSGSQNQGNGSASSGSSNQIGASNLGDFNIVILSSRLAEDWEGNPVVIVKYKFTNNSNDAAAFWTSVDDSVYQNDIGLNECYLVDDSANYSSDNQTKEIKKGASLEVEVAYELNDETTPIVVEVEEYFSYSDKKVTKTFTIN